MNYHPFGSPGTPGGAPPPPYTQHIPYAPPHAVQGFFPAMQQPPSGPPNYPGQPPAFGVPGAYGVQPNAAAAVPSYMQPYGGQNAQQLEVISGWFNAFDTDRSGELDAAEIQRALHEHQYDFGKTDVDSMVRAFDSNGDRKLNFEEFSRLFAFLKLVREQFDFYDQDRSRTLQLNEVLTALVSIGYPNLGQQPGIVQAMMQRHDPSNDSSMTLDDYIRMCLFLHSCAKAFNAFDVQHTGRVTLDFAQFVHAASFIA